jgi:hypothetical protein
VGVGLGVLVNIANGRGVRLGGMVLDGVGVSVGGGVKVNVGVVDGVTVGVVLLYRSRSD